MGSVVGEKVSRLIEVALEERRAVVIVTASGGARMQEGILSLMQMAKTSGLLATLKEARLPFVSILTDPSTAGVMASYASLGDVIFAEPGALIGFAGPRVIQDTIGEELPPGFQRSDFVLEHGMVDAVIPRKEMRENVARLLGYFWQSTDGFKAAPADFAYRP
jgi:acetyl-CoA carboxylase carboxyl transferase subunit beta